MRVVIIAVVPKRIKKLLLRLAMFPAFVVLMLAISGTGFAKWTGLQLFRHQYRHLTQSDEQSEVVKQEER